MDLLASSYTDQKVWAAIAAVVLIVVVAFVLPLRLKRGRRQPGVIAALGVITGTDNRLSTGKTVALLWTTVILYILLALIFVWPSGSHGWDKALANLGGPYFAVLGGPYAALVVSKWAVSSRVSSGHLQKTQAAGPALADLVADDDGQGSLFDIQYLVFNVAVMAFVIQAFHHATLAGFPSVPNTLWLLTAGPAAVYVAPKIAGSNAPVVFGVDTGIATQGAPFTVFGQNFMAGAKAVAGVLPSVQVDGVKAPGVLATPPTDTTITATVPSISPGREGHALRVTVLSATGVEASLEGAITVFNPPSLLGSTPDPLPQDSDVVFTGQWRAAPTAILFDTAVATATVVSPNSVSAHVPNYGLAAGARLVVNVSVLVGIEQSAKLQMTVVG